MDVRLRDVCRLVKKIDKLTDGQASVNLDSIDWDGTDPFTSFKLQIRPNGGHYKGGIFDFTVTLPYVYPSTDPPAVWCHTEVYHPNIDIDEGAYFDETSTNVCLNLFEHGTWQTSYTLELMVLGLIFLFHHPNLADPLADGFSGNETEAEFAENVRKYMAGEDSRYKTNFKVIDGVLVEHYPETKKAGNNKVINPNNDSIDSVKDEHNSNVSVEEDEADNDCSDSSFDSCCSELSDTEVSSDIPENESSDNDDNNNHKTKEGLDYCEIKKIPSFKETVIPSETPNQNKVPLDVVEIRENLPSKSIKTDGCKDNVDNNSNCNFQNDISANLNEDTNYDKEDANDDNNELVLEYVNVDGEFILKPKSIDIEETGIVRTDRVVGINDEFYDNDSDIDAAIDEMIRAVRKSRRRCGCFRPLRRLLERLFTRCRRSK